MTANDVVWLYENNKINADQMTKAIEVIETFENAKKEAME